MKSILITGASGEVGMEFIRHFLNRRAEKPEIIIGIYDGEEFAGELLDLAKQHEILHVFKLSYDEFSLYPVLAENVAGLVGEDGLNALFLNATYNTESPSEMGELTYDTLMIPLKVNTISPIMLTKALLPLLKKAAEVNSSLPIGVHRAAIIFMSSIYGSINSNHTGRWWGFRESKAAANMAMRSMAAEFLKYGIATLIVVPGNKSFPQTEVRKEGTPRTSKDILRCIMPQMMALSTKTTGHFLHNDGSKIPW